MTLTLITPHADMVVGNKQGGPVLIHILFKRLYM